MSAQGYWCLGGPLHGMLRAEPEGTTRFPIYELGKGRNSYELRDHPQLGKAWVYEQKEPT